MDESKLLKERMLRKSRLIDLVEEYSIQILGIQAEIRYLDFEIENLIDKIEKLAQIQKRKSP